MVQPPGDMDVSATFNIGDSIRLVEDYFEDPSNLRTNPLKEGEADADQDAITHEGKGKHLSNTALLSMFVLTHLEWSRFQLASSKALTVLLMG